ncbi:hypothetical protein AH06_12 [Erwinia phage AH06]|nr:hypothetical protein AH06_12 [Erwinia phage AH06]
MTTQATEEEPKVEVPAGSLVEPVIESVHPPVVRAMNFAGVLAVVTTCLCAVAFFANMSIHVWRNGSWPPNVGAVIVAVVLIGPVLTAWQFMGVRKILTSLLSNENGLGLGGIAKEVVARRMGFQYQPTQPMTQQQVQQNYPQHNQPAEYPSPPVGYAQNVPPVPPGEDAR